MRGAARKIPREIRCERRPRHHIREKETGERDPARYRAHVTCRIGVSGECEVSLPQRKHRDHQEQHREHDGGHLVHDVHHVVAPHREHRLHREHERRSEREVDVHQNLERDHREHRIHGRPPDRGNDGEQGDRQVVAVKTHRTAALNLLRDAQLATDAGQQPHHQHAAQRAGRDRGEALHHRQPELRGEEAGHHDREHHVRGEPERELASRAAVPLYIGDLFCTVRFRLGQGCTVCCFAGSLGSHVLFFLSVNEPPTIPGGGITGEKRLRGLRRFPGRRRAATLVA